MNNEQEMTDGAGAALKQSPPQTESSTPVHRTIGDTSPSVAVVEALAEAQGVSPLDVSDRLCDVIDTDALDSLFRSGDETDRSGRVVFTASGFEITVTATGDIYVHDA